MLKSSKQKGRIHGWNLRRVPLLLRVVCSQTGGKQFWSHQNASFRYQQSAQSTPKGKNNLPKTINSMYSRVQRKPNLLIDNWIFERSLYSRTRALWRLSIIGENWRTLWAADWNGRWILSSAWGYTDKNASGSYCRYRKRASKTFANERYLHEWPLR